MTRFFTRERFGRLQLFAGALLLVFLAQTVWLIHSEAYSAESTGWPQQNTLELGASEKIRLSSGWRQLHHGPIAGAPYALPPASLESTEAQADADVSGFNTEHSPLLSLLTAAPLLLTPGATLDPETLPRWRWLPRLPFLACGVLLGASLWYVARRLCGNAGGFLALTLYCFSPSMIQAGAVWHTEPEILAAWGAFGAIFTGVAVAHTLYAPREVILWNWRRIILLGISIAIAVGSQFSMVIVLPLVLGLMLYLAPVRRAAVFIIWIAASLLAVALLFATYFFHAHSFAEGMRHASFWGATWHGFAVTGVYWEVAAQILRACPALVVLLPVALATYFLWPRSRYFGNTAPGLVALLFIALAMAHPHVAGAGFLLASIPFLLVFVSGVIADLMETSYRPLVTAGVGGLLGAYVMWTMLALFHVPRG